MVISYYNTNYTKLVKFQELRFFTVDECIELMQFHVNNKYLKIGLGNNLSLINYNPLPVKVSYSFIKYNLKPFNTGKIIVLPFKIMTDIRGIYRYYCRINDIRYKSLVFNMSGEELFNNDKKIVLQNIENRILSGFNWSGNISDKKILRYRLNWVLGGSRIRLNSNLDIHHHLHNFDALTGDFSNEIIDDTIKQTKILSHKEHGIVHKWFGDSDFI